MNACEVLLNRRYPALNFGRQSAYVGDMRTTGIADHIIEAQRMHEAGER